MSDALTFLGGTAVGALVTYLTKDEDTRKAVERFIDGVADSFAAFLGRITPEKRGETTEESAEAVKTTAEEVAVAAKPAVEELAEPEEKATKSESAVSEKKTAVEETAVH